MPAEGLVEAAAEVFPETDWQRCVGHFYCNVFNHMPNARIADAARMLKAMLSQKDARAVSAKAADAVKCLRKMKRKSVVDLVEQRLTETLTYYATRRTTGGRSARTIRWNG